MYLYLKKAYVFIYSFIYALHMFETPQCIVDARYSVVRIFLNTIWVYKSAYKSPLRRIDRHARNHIREAASVIYIFKGLFYFRKKKKRVVGLKGACTGYPYTFMSSALLLSFRDITGLLEVPQLLGLKLF